MVSVTSIVPSGMTIVSDWKFSMRSSRVLRAEAGGKMKARTSGIAKNPRIATQRSRVIPCAAPASCRWRAEADFGRFAFRRGRNFEELALLKSEHIGEDIRRELLNLGVQVADHGVVIAPRVLYRIFDLSERSLQRCEALNSSKLRICFRKCKQTLQRAGKHVLCLRLVAGAGRGHGAIARVDHRLQCAFFVPCVTFDRLHQVGDQ